MNGKKNRTFTKEELKVLSSRKAVEYLLMDEFPDFRKVLNFVQYEKALEVLQIELIKVQNWVIENEERILILVEGHEFSGKGTAIRKFTERLNPRAMQTVALQKPSPKEMGQWYFKRYIEKIPEKGELVFFDRSWYNRAVVEPVNGFCSQEEYKRFMKEVILFEEMLRNDGIRILKIYLSITKKEQKRRLEFVKQDPLRKWELSPVDRRAQELWDDYKEYKTEMLKKTSTKLNPWFTVRANERTKAHVKALNYILSRLPYKKQ